MYIYYNMSTITNRINDPESYRKVLDEWKKFGSVLLLSRILSNQFLSNHSLDYKWVSNTLAILCGFTLYRIFIENIVDTDSWLSGKIKNSIDQTFRVGTMLLFSRFITGGEFNSTWLKSSLSTIIGFMGYDLVLSNIKDTIDNEYCQLYHKYNSAITDVVRFGSMFLISQYVKSDANTSIYDIYDSEWKVTSLAFIVSLVIYNLSISYYI